jgi:hypothetical protein
MRTYKLTRKALDEAYISACIRAAECRAEIANLRRELRAADEKSAQALRDIAEFGGSK